MPCWARSTLSHTRSRAHQIGACARAASRSSLVQRRAVSSTCGRPPRAARRRPVGELRPAHLGAVAVLLRAYVRRLELVDGRGEAPDAGREARVRYASPGPRPNHSSRPSAAGSAIRRPSRGSGNRPLALRLDRHRAARARRRRPSTCRSRSSPRSEPAAATRVRTTSPSAVELDRDDAVAHRGAARARATPRELARRGADVVVGRRAPHVEPRSVERERAEPAQHARRRVEHARRRARCVARRRCGRGGRRRRPRRRAARGATGSCPQATSCPAGAHGSSAASRPARSATPRRGTVGSAGSGSGRRARPAATGPDVERARRPPARPPPPAPRRTSRCERSRNSCRFSIAHPAGASP